MRDLRREACNAVFSERFDYPGTLRSRGTVTGNPTRVAGPRGETATGFDGTVDKVSIPVNRSMNSFEGWVYFESITEEVCDFDGGTHFIKATAGTLAATGWAAPTIYVDGAATTTVTVGWHHIAATSATAFTCTNFVAGTDNVGFGAIRVFGVTLWSRVLTAAEAAQEFNGTTWDYDLAMTHRWDLSSLASPDHVGTVNMVDTGLVASTDIVAQPYGGYATQYNGTDEKSTAGDVGTVRSVSFMVRPDSTGAVTEEIILLSTGNDIMVSGGTITYAGVTASATYVDGVATTALAAGKWQHVVCVLSADHAASAFAVATDGTNFGAISIDDVRTYSTALTNLVAADMARRATRGR
jgi:hypothetical protein